MTVTATLSDGTVLSAPDEIELAQKLDAHYIEHGHPTDGQVPTITHDAVTEPTSSPSTPGEAEPPAHPWPSQSPAST